RAGLAPDGGGPIGDGALAGELSGRWSEPIETGIAKPSKALSIDTSHEAAMATLSAWHRVRADLAMTIDRHRDELAAAESWRQKALAIPATPPSRPLHV